MNAAAQAILPIFGLIALGYVLRSRSLVAIGFWEPAERLTYWLFFPALLISNLAEARLGDLQVLPLLGAELAGIAAVMIIAAVVAQWLLGPWLNLQGSAISSIIQGVQRPNSYIAFALGASLYGAPGLTLAAVCSALVIPPVNILAIMSLVHWAQHGHGAPKLPRMILAMVTNPLILASLIGAALNATGVGLPPVIGPALKILGPISLGLGLMVVGAGLDLGGVRRMIPPLALVCICKLAILPLIVWVAGRALGLEGVPLMMAVLYGAVPTSTSSFVLAKQMGGDHRLMAAIISVSTVAALATMPLITLALEPR